MIQAVIYEGTPEQLVKQFYELPRTRKYRVMVVSEEMDAPEKQPKMITFGMFPQLQALTDDIFKSAEWQGEALARTPRPAGGKSVLCQQ